jgi:hypothetical protein
VSSLWPNVPEAVFAAPAHGGAFFEFAEIYVYHLWQTVHIEFPVAGPHGAAQGNARVSVHGVSEGVQGAERFEGARHQALPDRKDAQVLCV